MKIDPFTQRIYWKARSDTEAIFSLITRRIVGNDRAVFWDFQKVWNFKRDIFEKYLKGSNRCFRDLLTMHPGNGQIFDVTPYKGSHFLHYFNTLVQCGFDKQLLYSRWKNVRIMDPENISSISRRKKGLILESQKDLPPHSITICILLKISPIL